MSTKTPAPVKHYWPPGILTVEQVKYVLGELSALKAWLKGYDRSVRVGSITKSPKPVLSPETILLIPKTAQANIKAADVDQLIAKVETAAQDAPKIHISLPTLPELEVKQDLANWFRNNISPKVLLSFSADATLGGGMAVRTRNRLYNFSLRRLLWQNRGLIPEIVRRA